MRFVQAVTTQGQVDDDDPAIVFVNVEQIIRFNIDPFWQDASYGEGGEHEHLQRYYIEMHTGTPQYTEEMTPEEMHREAGRFLYFSPVTFDNPVTAREWLLKSKEAHSMEDTRNKAYTGEKPPGAGWSTMPKDSTLPTRERAAEAAGKTHQHWSIQLPSWTSGDYVFTVQLKYGVVDSDQNWAERGGKDKETLKDVKFYTRRILIPGNAGDLGTVQEQALRELKSLAQQWADEVGEPVSGGLESFVFYVNDNEAGRMKYDEMTFVEDVKPMQTRFNIPFGDGDDLGGPVTAHVS